jgi:hypothetical protein
MIQRINEWDSLFANIIHHFLPTSIWSPEGIFLMIILLLGALCVITIFLDGQGGAGLIGAVVWLIIVYIFPDHPLWTLIVGLFVTAILLCFYNPMIGLWALGGIFLAFFLIWGIYAATDFFNATEYKEFNLVKAVNVCKDCVIEDKDGAAGGKQANFVNTVNLCANCSILKMENIKAQTVTIKMSGQGDPGK